MISSSTASTSIAPTITPARYTNNVRTLSQTKPSRPLHGPQQFFTSAKTDAGVSEVFGYVARRVVMWEWEEAHASWPVVETGHRSSCRCHDWEEAGVFAWMLLLIRPFGRR
jgi:hypothetical protein